MPPSAPNRFVRERLPWIIAVLALVAVLATVYMTRRAPADRGAAGSEVAANAAADDARPSAGAASGAAHAQRPSSRAPGDAFPGEGEPNLTPQQVAAQRERQLQELEAAFARDVADADGGGQAEDALGRTLAGDAMAGTGLQADDVDIACKQSSCRIVGRLATMGDAQDWGLFFITAAGGEVLAQSQMMFVPTPDGRTEVRIFATRNR